MLKDEVRSGVEKINRNKAVEREWIVKEMHLTLNMFANSKISQNY